MTNLCFKNVLMNNLILIGTKHMDIWYYGNTILYTLKGSPNEQSPPG